MVLEPGAGETILTAAETLDWLAERLAAMSQAPADLVDLAGPQERAQRLLERVRAAPRTRHYSRRTKAAYVGWNQRFILFHDKRYPA